MFGWGKREEPLEPEVVLQQEEGTVEDMWGVNMSQAWVGKWCVPGVLQNKGWFLTLLTPTALVHITVHTCCNRIGRGMLIRSRNGSA